MNRSIRLAGLAALAVGCADIEGPDVRRAPSLSEDGFLRPAASHRRSATANMAGRKWFDITINAGGTLRPDRNIDLTITYEAIFATPDAEISVVLPEAENAGLSAWDEDYRVRTGTPLRARFRANSAFSAGGAVTRSVDFAVEEPGIYSVVASAKSRRLRADETTAPAQPVVHEVLWLVVDEAGGRVLDRFDADAVPEGHRRQPGPFRRVGAGPAPGENGQGLAPSLAGSSSCGSDEVCVKVSYWDSDLEEYTVMPEVHYEYAIVDGQTGDVEYEAEGYADGDGVFTLACPSVGEDVSGRVSMDNSAAKIVPNTEAGAFSVGPGDCGHTLDVVAASDEGRTWTNAMYSIDNSRDRMDSRSKVNIAVNQPSQVQECHWDKTTTTIKLLNTEDDDCIWGGYGVFTFPHEYGHAVHEELGGGTARIGNGCSSHYPGTPVETSSRRSRARTTRGGPTTTP